MQFSNNRQHDLTLEEFFDRIFLPIADKTLRYDTVYGYRKVFNRLIRPYFSGVKLDDLDQLTLVEWLVSFEPKAAREAWKMMHTILSRAVKFGLLATNPLDSLPRPKVEQYTPEVLSIKDFIAYFDLYRGTDIEAVVLVIMGVGLNRSEALALNWSDVLPDGRVVVDNAYIEAPGKTYDSKTKNEFRNRIVHLPASIIKRLNELRPACEFYQDPQVHKLVPRPLAVKPDLISRMSPDYLSHHFRSEQKRLPEGIAKISLKNMRHTSLTLTIEAGVPIFAVSRRAGHASTEITSRYYLRPHENVDIAAADALDNYLSKNS